MRFLKNSSSLFVALVLSVISATSLAAHRLDADLSCQQLLTLTHEFRDDRHAAVVSALHPQVGSLLLEYLHRIDMRLTHYLEGTSTDQFSPKPIHYNLSRLNSEIKLYLFEIQQLSSDLSSEDPELNELIDQEILSIRKKLSSLFGEASSAILDYKSLSSDVAIIEIVPERIQAYQEWFVGELYRMYTSYAHQKGWEVTILDRSAGNSYNTHAKKRSDKALGSIILKISGPQAYSFLRHETGYHKRKGNLKDSDIPEAEKVFTVGAYVTVTPEPKDGELSLKESDLEVQYVISQGPNVQNGNKAANAVRITHIPSGLSARSQEASSQSANYGNALEIVRAKLFAKLAQESEKARRAARPTQLRTDKSDYRERRTYSFAENQVRDKQTGFTTTIQDFMTGGLDEAIRAHQNKLFEEVLLDNLRGTEAVLNQLVPLP